METEQTPLRTAIMRIMSEMVDGVDDDGIYDTGKFMDKIEQLVCDMMAAPEVMQLSGSEAVMGLLAWLTTRDETTVLGPRGQVDVSLYDRFVEANHLTEPRECFGDLLVHPDPLPLPSSLTIEVAANVEPTILQELEEFGFTIKLSPSTLFPIDLSESVSQEDPSPSPFAEKTEELTPLPDARVPLDSDALFRALLNELKTTR